jgi:hypothetical protein
VDVAGASPETMSLVALLVSAVLVGVVALVAGRR